MSRSSAAATSPTASVATQNMTGRAMFMNLQCLAKTGRGQCGRSAPTCLESECDSKVYCFVLSPSVGCSHWMPNFTEQEIARDIYQRHKLLTGRSRVIKLTTLAVFIDPIAPILLRAAAQTLASASLDRPRQTP